MMIREISTLNTKSRVFVTAKYIPSIGYWKVTDPPYAASYMSMFGYNETPPEREHLLRTNVFYLDYDNPALGMSLRGAQRTCRWLETVHDVDLRQITIYFSGKKGFHLGIPVALFTGKSEILVHADRMRLFAEAFPDLDKTLDKSIYDHRRLFRVPGSMHPVSGLRKIQLTATELFTLDPKAIRTLAEPSRRPAIFTIEEPIQSESLTRLFTALASAPHPHSVPDHPALMSSSAISPPRSVDLAGGQGQALHDYFRPAMRGTRNVTAARLAGVLVGKQIDLALLQEILLLWNMTNTDPLHPEELGRTVYSVFKTHQRRHRELQHGESI